jgi:hypothetical protein
MELLAVMGPQEYNAAEVRTIVEPKDYVTNTIRATMTSTPPAASSPARLSSAATPLTPAAAPGRLYVGDGSWNHINWEIRLQDGGSADNLIMSYEKCVNALNRELGGCANGSEQNNGGFWYKIDPNYGPCGTPQGP